MRKPIEQDSTISSDEKMNKFDKRMPAPDNFLASLIMKSRPQQARGASGIKRTGMIIEPGNRVPDPSKRTGMLKIAYFNTPLTAAT